MNPPALRLFLIRHGEVPSNRELRYVGSRDEPLVEAGIRQAEGLAAALAPMPVSAVYTSPLRRAEETGRRIAAARDVPLRLEPRLREQSFGAWEGLTRVEALERDRDLLLRWEADLGSAPPGGESLESVRERILSLVGDLVRVHPREWVALVSHVGPIKALLCHALGAPLSTARRMFLDPGTLSVVDWGERPVVRLFNAHGHLGWEAARWMKE
ncbi:MAG TPA: histidine phosphatase family protein [Thermoanaerobaculia bacterium]|nr:histidine phosphatase family protein [Thermoanaerobaculia bacterium]